jgi:protocatechuate 3,4-dioxygenase alpha subunit
MGEPALTPAQTVGPFLHLALAEPALRHPVAVDDPAAVTLHGVVVDGDGEPVPDAVVETWQLGGPFARCATETDGSWVVRVRRPVAVATLDGTPQAPHLAVSVFARGLLDRVVTRIYFGGDPANAHDPTLLAAAGRAATMVAKRDGPASFRFDIRLQGPDETVFLAI